MNVWDAQSVDASVRAAGNSRRKKLTAGATVLATVAAFSLAGGAVVASPAHAAVQICTQNATGQFVFEGAQIDSIDQPCTIAQTAVVKIVARGAGGGVAAGLPYPGGAGAVVTTYQYLPQGTVLTIKVGSTSYNPRGGGSATSVTGNGVTVVAGGGGGGGTLGAGGTGAAANTPAGGSGSNSGGGFGGQATGQGGNGAGSGGGVQGIGGSGSANGTNGTADWGGGGGGFGGGNGGSSGAFVGGSSAAFSEAGSAGGGNGAGFGGGGAGGAGGGGGYGGGGGGALAVGQSYGGGAGGSFASTTRASVGYATTYQPGGAQHGNQQQNSGSVTISFERAAPPILTQHAAGACAGKIPAKRIKRKGKKNVATVVLPANCRTNAGRNISVAAKWFLKNKNVTKKRAGTWLKRKNLRNRKVNLISKNVPKKTKVVLTYTAPGGNGYHAYRATKTIRLRK